MSTSENFNKIASQFLEFIGGLYDVLEEEGLTTTNGDKLSGYSSLIGMYPGDSLIEIFSTNWENWRAAKDKKIDFLLGDWTSFFGDKIDSKLLQFPLVVHSEFLSGKRKGESPLTDEDIANTWAYIHFLSRLSSEFVTEKRVLGEYLPEYPLANIKVEFAK